MREESKFDEFVSWIRGSTGDTFIVKDYKFKEGYGNRYRNEIKNNFKARKKPTIMIIEDSEDKGAALIDFDFFNKPK